jgi:hypothetical protein
VYFVVTSVFGIVVVKWSARFFRVWDKYKCRSFNLEFFGCVNISDGSVQSISYEIYPIRFQFIK